MKILKPIAVTPEKLISSNVPAQDYPLWSSSIAYLKGQRVQLGTRVYESLQSSNTGYLPTADEAQTWWNDLGPSNRWAMFDGQIDTQTTAKDANAQIEVTLNLGRLDALALVGVVAASVRVEVLESLANPVVVHVQTASLVYRNVSSWYEYFTRPFTTRNLVYFTGLPPFAGSLLRVSISGSQEVRCGALLAGIVSDVGRTRYGATVGINDYSRKVTNDFGATTLVPRAWSKRGSFPVELSQYDLERVFELLASLRGQAYLCVGIEADGYSPAVIYGFTKDFSIDLALPKTNYCTLSIEGLI